ncbi:MULTISPECIES: helix-turn-helix transcriptional regulator [Amycolatopsis]|uniref:Helix-turn-helix domain-containing protein n=1 Tax=Amycolatopsis albidoflavus TaxID=102226 RepID=A0ABW5IEW3_9PSEU
MGNRRRAVRQVSSVPETFGSRVRAMRVAEGLSLSEFARRLYYSKGHVSRVETGAQAPSPEFVRKCDALLGAAGELIELAGEAERASRPIAAGATEEEVWVMTMMPDGGGAFNPVARRDVLLGGMAVIAGLKVSGTGVVAVDAEAQLIQHRRLFDAARDLGQASSPDVVLPMVVGQAQALRTLAAQVGGRALAKVASLAARTAEYAGWMAQESGDDEAAAWWTARAVRVSGVAGDDFLSSYALVRQALIAMYQGDGAETVALARQAQERKTVPARVLGLAAQREAQGHALAGDPDGCMRALDRARAWLQDPAGMPAGPVIGTSQVADPVGVATGWCLYDLGRPAEAASVLDREIARIPHGAVRARTRFGLRLCLAYAASGELEQACRLAQPLLAQIVQLGSATIRTDLRKLAVVLRRWHAHPAVRVVSPELTAVLSAAR